MYRPTVRRAISPSWRFENCANMVAWRAGTWLSGLKRRLRPTALALTSFQRELLGAIAANRSPDSVLFGGAALNLKDPRLSNDLDIPHPTRDAVKFAYSLDQKTLSAAGCTVTQTEWSRPEKGFVQAIVTRQNEQTLIDWTQDSAWRFFPAVRDEEVGWRLHDADLAVNKVLALAGRREPRDYYDIVRLHQRGVSLAALAWAAPAKDPGFTPDLILDEISRNSIFDPKIIAQEILSREPVDPIALKRVFTQALAEARDLFASLQTETPGNLYIDATGAVALPNSSLVEAGRLQRHAASLGGVWPSIIQNGQNRR